MAFYFNPIALKASMDCATEVMLAGSVIGKMVHYALSCPRCGEAYNLLVPVTASMSEIEESRTIFHGLLHCTCGKHPPVLQIQ
jgi:hypothetical protein